MAGQYRFKDGSGNIVAQISASVDGVISFSGSQINFSEANSINLGEVQLAGTASNALLLDGFDSQAFAFTSSIHPFTASIAGTNTFTSSATARLNSIETISSSNIGRLNSLEEKTGSLATTGSNTFIGTQTITGSLYITTDLIVQGSSSLQNITASAVSIGTNLINLNTANPAIRYAGLSIGDSGSVGGSGSFLYDSVQDEFIFIHRGANTTVTSSVVLMGPQTYDSVGSETYLTNNRLVKGTGNEHIVDSSITDTGTQVSMFSNTLFISSSNRIGINTSTPSTALTVVGNIKAGYESATGMIIGLAPSGIPASDVNSYILWADAASFGGNNGDIIYIPRTSTDGMHRFYTGNGTPTEKLRITHTGLVGIGTNNPQSKLHIYDSAVGGTYFGQLVVEQNGEAAINIKGVGYSSIYFGDAANPIEGAIVYDHSTNNLELRGSGNSADLTIYPAGGVVIAASSTNQTLTTGDAGITRTNTYFGTGQVRIGGGSDHGSNTVLSVAPGIINFDRPGIGGGALKIDSNGNVGIGRTDPTFKLQVTEVGTTIVSGNAISTSTMKGIRIDNTNNSNESVGVWFNTGGSHWSGISGQRTGTGGVEGWATDLRFYTHENSTVDLTYARERMRISSEGHVTIPSQPSLLAQPNSAGNFTIGGNTHCFGWNVSGGIRHNVGFTLSGSTVAVTNVADAANSGKITIPSSGRYLLQFSFRNETGTSADGQFTLWVNGTQRIRRHIELWNGKPYIHVDVTAVLNLSGGDTLEMGCYYNGATSGQVSGTNDSVNWLSLVKVA